MDVQLKSPIVQSHASQVINAGAERPILFYWLLSTIAGVVVVGDWLWSWNVAATLSNPGFVIYLLVSFAITQVLYVIVARHDGRPLSVAATVIFTLGNGFCETLAFAVVYRLGELLGAGIVGMFAPAAASIAGFCAGLLAFIVYGGLIHAFFWLPLLPPHFDNAPRSLQIRKIRPVFEVALVLGWSLCFWLYRDIWTVVLIHFLVDLGLMVRVRPTLFVRRPA